MGSPAHRAYLRGMTDPYRHRLRATRRKQSGTAPFAWLALLVFLAAPALAAEPTSLTVSVDPVRRQPVAATVAGTGVVEAWQEATIGAETSGLVLAEVLVSEGDRVERGQVVARLDGALLEAQMAESDAAIRSAAATLRDAEAANARAGQLVKTGNVTAETAEQRATAVETAAAALDQAKAKRQTLAVQVERTAIRAPFAGIVSAKPAVAGAVVQVGTEILRLQRDAALEAKLKIPEAKLGSLHVGDAALLVGPDGETTQAPVSSLSATVDPVTHLGLVSVCLPRETVLKAGMFVRGTIRLRSGDPLLTVAASALAWNEGEAAVFAVGGDGLVSRRVVRLGTREGERVAVSGDLTPGESVVTAGAGFLNDGDRVAVAERSALLEGTSR